MGSDGIRWDPLPVFPSTALVGFVRRLSKEANFQVWYVRQSEVSLIDPGGASSPAVSAALVTVTRPEPCSGVPAGLWDLRLMLMEDPGSECSCQIPVPDPNHARRVRWEAPLRCSSNVGMTS